MASVLSTSIITPLGLTAGETLQAVLEGRTALSRHEPSASLPLGYTASLFTPEQNAALAIDGYTRFEALAIRAIRAALEQAPVPPSGDTLLVLSSTKGNVELLGTDAYRSLGESAVRIARAVGLDTTPVVACNACVSGVTAITTAARLIDNGSCRHAIVCGADVQSPFVISGFHSLKAMAEGECRPFDIERLGLNLGEGAAAMILGPDTGTPCWHIAGAAASNDAHHITNPSPDAAGSRRAIDGALRGAGPASLAMVNTHGTATMYNDQMESKAISLSGLSDVPANALKGYLGHTMGAAGVIETALTMLALDRGLIPGTRGYAERGVSGRVDISPVTRSAHKKDFLKIISGFGGVNAALHLIHGPAQARESETVVMHKLHRVRITPGSVVLDGAPVKTEGSGMRMLTYIYKSLGIDYPRYYKMDALARLGFVASELLLSACGKEADTEGAGECAVVFFNSNASVGADREYLRTISDPDAFFPSPAHFVYTLPNIVAGELAIRHGYHGETGFYILPAKDPDAMNGIAVSVLSDPSIGRIIAGWLEHRDDNDFEADLFLAEKMIYTA